MKHLRIISALLALLMVTASCSGAADDNNDTADASQTSDTTAPEETGPVLDLPEELDYTGKTFRLITAEGYLLGSNEEDADSVSRAIYKQFFNTTERLGIEYEIIEARPFELAASWVRQSVNANLDEYDAVFTVDTQQRALISEGFYLSVNDLPYINLDNIWWNKSYIESVSINPNDPYVLFGDITYNSIQRLSCVFFNKRLMKELHGLEDTDIYQMVHDGKWTLDKFIELACDVYQDNGNTEQDPEDLHGAVTNGFDSLEYLAFSSGLEFAKRDEEGWPTININNDQSIALAEKLLSLYKNDSFYNTEGKNGTNDYIAKFAAGNALFCVQRFFIASGLREMVDDYGIVPIPKYDETINRYSSTVTQYVQWGAVPVTCGDPAMVSAVLESLAYEGYQHVIPEYYDITLKLKYTRGDVDLESQMLDIITQNMRTDFLYANRLGGLGNIFKDILVAGENTFSSLYAASEKAAIANLEDMIDEAKNK